MIEAALAESNGRISGTAGAAAKLGLPSRTLDSKIKRLKINKYQIQAPSLRSSIDLIEPHRTFLIAKEFLNNQDSRRT